MRCIFDIFILTTKKEKLFSIFGSTNKNTWPHYVILVFEESNVFIFYTSKPFYSSTVKICMFIYYRQEQELNINQHKYQLQQKKSVYFFPGFLL